MLLQMITYISFLLSSLFLVSRYITKRRKPLSSHSPISDKLMMGFFYGMIGVGLMYIHKVFAGDVADLRQIVVLLSLFYGGWIPCFVSSALLLVFRLILFEGLPVGNFMISLIGTVIITQIVIKSKIPRSKQWYLITATVTLEVCTLLWLHGTYSSFMDPDLLRFAFIFILGSVFSYHFTESLWHSYEVVEALRLSKENLQQSEANYRLIADHSSDLVAVMSVDGVALYLSPSHLPVTGTDPDKYIGKQAIELIHHEDFPQILVHWATSVREKKAAQVEYRYRHADGHYIWIESSYVPVLGSNGEVDRIVAISRDVTERKRTEELYRDAEKLSVVGELAAGIAHEIRNPLTTLKGFIQIMKKDSFQPFYLDVMYEELGRIDSITNELLYLAKPQIQELKQTNITEMLDQICTLMNPQAILHNVRLAVQYEQDLPLVTCVENRLKQVFINLLKNSIEAMPDGGEIIIQSRQQDDHSLVISVKDQGCGIPEQRLEKLGQPFYSLKEKGTGLGLTVCKKIIQEHHGSIKFHSKVGVGTTVELCLPINRTIPSLRSEEAMSLT